jgi:hypothetical protein
MLTTRRRYTLTETRELAKALDAAAAMWPEICDDRAALLRRLIETGRQTVAQSFQNHIRARREVLHRVAGAATGAYPPDAAERRKAEWPE